jgi:hypothetical protein
LAASIATRSRIAPGHKTVAASGQIFSGRGVLVMWFVYFDESKQDNKVFVYSALIVDGEQWNSAFEGLKNLRRDLRSKHGVYMRQELHAWKFAAGKGQIADRPVLKP